MPLLRVQEINNVSVNSVEILFSIPENERIAYKFSPGEYVTLHVPVNGRTYVRCYSISRILEDDHLVICVKHVPKGIVSTHLFLTLQLGDEIEVEYPEGNFKLKKNVFNPKQSIVFITGGSGITPIVPMIQALIAKSYKGEIILIYGSQNSDAIIYKKLLSEFEPKLKLIHVLESSAEVGKGIEGRLSKDFIIDLISQLGINSQKSVFYCTGPPVVVNNALNALAELGVKSSKIHSEKFFLDNQKYSDGKDRAMLSPNDLKLMKIRRMYVRGRMIYHSKRGHGEV